MFRPIYRPIYRAIASALTQSLPGGFNPASLFTDGSKGVLYDNNDLSSFYLDSAGTTAATVNGLVGLQLDKSQGLVLGAETLNGSGSASGTWSYSSDVITRNGSTTGLAQSGVNAVVGKTYLITFTVSGISGDTFFIRCGSAASGNISANGSYTLRLTATASQSVFQANPWGGTAGEATISGISVKELAGNHRYQTTTGSKPVLRGTPTGANLVTNGDFASGTGWTTGAGWAIGSGVATKTAGTADSIFQAYSFVVGKVYRVTYTVTRTAGAVVIRFSGGTVTAGANRSASGTYVEYLTAQSGNAFVSILGDASFAGTIDNIEVVDVSAGSVTAPYGLQYDGVDDFLQTAAVDFTATDKMFVCAGVRSMPVASVGKVVELGTNATTVAGTFCLETDSATGNPFAVRAFGSATGTKGENSATSPRLSVVSAVIDVAKATTAEEIVIRVNGAEPAQTAFGGPLGAGNFTSNPLYFGRRAGTSQPLNGLDFGMVICGKTLTSNQISSTERYIAQRTGISL